MDTKMTRGHSNLTLLKELNSTIKRLSIYPADHPAVKLVLKETSELFQEFFKTKTEIVLGKVENKLVLEGETLDANLISEKVWNTLEKQKIKSISFLKWLSQEELRSFLEFFLKKEEEDLSAYLQKNKITHLRLNQLHYEVVSDDEKVVKAELMDKLQLKGELSRVIREHPELLKDILLGKLIQKEKLQMLYKETALPSSQEDEGKGSGSSGSGGGGWGEGGGEGIGVGIDLKKTLEDLKAEIYSLSDDEILALLTYQLKQSFQNMPQNKESSDEALQMVKKALEKRDKRKLLPQLKELLSSYGIIDERYFDLLINELYQKEEEIVFSALQFLEELEKNRIEKKNLEEKIKGILHSPDEKLKKKIIDTLIEKLDSKDNSLRQDSIAVLKKMIELSSSEEKEEDFVYIKDKLLGMPEDTLASFRFYQGYFELLPLLFSNLAKKGNLQGLSRFLSKIRQNNKDKEELPELGKLKTDFVTEISTEQNLNLLLKPAIADFNTQRGKELEEILENLEKRKVAQKLLEIFTVEQRNVRLWALRVLSTMGEDSIETISLFFTSEDDFKKRKDQGILADESWYRIRNMLFVLGNIESQKAVDLLWDFKNSPDPRVRLEVLKALEKKKGEKVNQILAELLKDKEEEVHKKALNLISASGEKEFIPALKDAFFKGHLDRKKLFAAMVKIGEEDCRDFALRLIVEESLFSGNIPKKEKEELQLTALNLLENNLDEKIFRALESHLRKRRKGLLGILHRDDVSGRIAKILSLRDKEINASRL
ncbi:MAG: HEAT repeat domain-containing protein [candidate division Zixibacteria bacterium]|nr:HEAT repeat domain-containing protein [candidate division Zixibacteria bacterium]